MPRRHTGCREEPQDKMQMGSQLHDQAAVILEKKVTIFLDSRLVES
jgi:hypothetical protein